MDMNVNLIKDLIGCLNSSGIDKLSLETDDFKLSLERNALPQTLQPMVMQASTVTAAVETQVAQAASQEPCGTIVKAPIVGTFYTSPSPDKPDFVKAGQQVKKGDILFIVESMKLMNEVASEFDGTVAEILVESGKPVEFGQAVMRII